MPFKPFNPLTFDSYSLSKSLGQLAHHFFFISASRLILLEIPQPFLNFTPTLWSKLPKDIRKFVHPHISPLNFTSPLLALSSAIFHSLLKTELFKLSYLDYTLCHHTTTTITEFHHSTMLFPQLDLLRFWPGTEQKVSLAIVELIWHSTGE